MVCEPEHQGEALGGAISALGYETVLCPTLDDCLRTVTQVVPDTLVVVLDDVSEASLSLLQLLRRATPGTPLVLAAPGATLETRARVLPLRPYYFAVPPVPTDELRAVIHGAVASHAPRS